MPGTGKGDPSALVHFAMVALVALGLSFILRNGMGRLRPLTVLLGVAALFCAFLPAMPTELLTELVNGRPPILALFMSLFMPVGFFLFFRAVPSGNEAFAFSMIHVGNELLWSLFFPLFSTIASQVSLTFVVYVYSLNCWVVGLAGLCLAIAFGYAVRETAATSVRTTQPVSSEPLLREKCTVLLLAFAAGIGVFGMMGFQMGSFMPKAAMNPELLSIPYFIFLFLLPVAGHFLDTRPEKLMLICIPGLAGLFCLSLAWQNGLIAPMSMYYPFSIAQQISLLIFYTTTARMLKGKAIFPFIISLGFCLHIAHFGGMFLRGLVQDLPHGVTAASLLLLVGTALCLWRFRTQCAKEPNLWPVAQRSTNMAAFIAKPGAESSAQSDYTAFAVRYSLSEREITVITMLAQGRSSEAIAEDLKVADSTIRTYISRILRKTGTKNRAALMERVIIEKQTG
ncbi:MAG: LuxR C-terminal-related transcriptional regulator [Deltaproteobacteria bacterium]|jgi:DNA-binding CsgD family transcriptional regulator|nr:LuxR C-terminal-related transcriptional regulator [Deltaproteobacteria bacterium]